MHNVLSYLFLICLLVLTVFPFAFCRDCENYFGKESLEPITDDDDVICVTHFSKVVPLEGGEVSVVAESTERRAK